MGFFGRRLHGQDFLLFLLRDFFQFMDVIVGQLLDFGERVLFVVFGDVFVFEHLFQVLVAVPADIADGGPMLLQDLMYVFGKLFPALFGERRNWDTNQTAVVGGVQTQVGGSDRFLNRTDQRNVIGLNRDQRRIRGSQLRNLINGSRRSVIVNLDIVQNGDRSPAGSYRCEFFTNIVDSLFHSLANLRNLVFDCHRRPRLR